MKPQPAIFEEYEIRCLYDEETEIWWFSVIDIIQVLTQQSDYQAARNYWKALKNRLNKEGSESVTRCNRLKLPVADDKNYLTDVATAETQPIRRICIMQKLYIHLLCKKLSRARIYGDNNIEENSRKTRY